VPWGVGWYNGERNQKPGGFTAMKKQIALALAVIMLALAFAACGGAGDPPVAITPPADSSLTPDNGGNTIPTPTDNIGEPTPFEPTPFEVGTVTIISNQNEYKPLEHWNHGFSDGMFASGWYLHPEHVTGVSTDEFYLSLIEGVLPDVIYSDDFQIIVEGNDLRSISYILYKNDFEYFDHEERFEYEKLLTGKYLDDINAFLHNTDDGEYILNIDIWWGNDDAESSYQYIFKIIKS
jgi:predicted small lipoprotein YifL